MTPLERELQLLSGGLDWPDSPDVAGRVASRMEGGRRRAVPRRRLALALATVLAALLAVLAVPPARTAILEWLRDRRRADRSGGRAPRGRPDSGDRVPRRAVHAVAGTRSRRIRVRRPTRRRAQAGSDPRGAGHARDVRVARRRSRPPARDPVPRQRGRPHVGQELVGSGTRIEELDVDGHRAGVARGRAARRPLHRPGGNVRDDLGWLAGNTLLMDVGGRTVRIEAAIDRDDAVELARSLVR